jgi:hypothetical protein
VPQPNHLAFSKVSEVGNTKMRMWMIEPELMCSKHLLGEHVELHMIVGCINKGKSIDGYLNKKLVDVYTLRKRHLQLVNEMHNRGYNHNSPLPKYEIRHRRIFIDIDENKRELMRRCYLCKTQIHEAKACPVEQITEA